MQEKHITLTVSKPEKMKCVSTKSHKQRSEGGRKLFLLVSAIKTVIEQYVDVVRVCVCSECDQTSLKSYSIKDNLTVSAYKLNYPSTM